MGVVLLLVLGPVGWFVATWLRKDWAAAMASIPGRAATSVVAATKTGAGWGQSRASAKRGLYLEDHRGKDTTEVIEIDHDRHHAPRSVLVCARDKGDAYARVATSLRPNSFQILPQRPAGCDLVKGRQHHQYNLRKRSGR